MEWQHHQIPGALNAQRLRVDGMTIDLRAVHGEEVWRMDVRLQAGLFGPGARVHGSAEDVRTKAVEATSARLREIADNLDAMLTPEDPTDG